MHRGRGDDAKMSGGRRGESKGARKNQAPHTIAPKRRSFTEKLKGSIPIEQLLAN
jgi:hypothetical protein